MSDFVIAVTGGIASGKSAVCEALAANGVEIIDADVISRELVAPGQPALAEILREFGAEALGEAGQLNRRWMRQRIFDDQDARLKLEAILHPRVRSELRARAAASAALCVALAIPLLIESGHYAWVDRLITVDAPETIQIARLMQRDGIERSLAFAMLAAQATRSERLAIADDVLINDSDLPTLIRMTQRLHGTLLQRAALKSATSA